MTSDNNAGLRGAVDLTRPIGVACILIGWFWLNTLITDLGRLQFNFHFPDLWTLIGNPAALLTGRSDGQTFATSVFSLLCIAAALAPLTALIRDTTATRLASLLPLIFMLLFGGLLYVKVSPDYFTTRARPDSIGGQFVALANSVTGSLVGKISERVTLGFGAYLSAGASLYLAFKAARRGLIVKRI